MESPKARKGIVDIPANNRTREGNSLAGLPNVDGRTWAGRRYRELVVDMAQHVGGDPSVPQLAILRRAAMLQTWCEQAEAEFANTGQLDVAEFTTVTNALRRLLVDLGLERRSRDVTPTLTAYIGGQRA